MADTFDDVYKFDNNLNTDWHVSDMDTRLNLGRTIVGGAVASVVDAGASIWNSLPGTPEVETSDLLRRISNDSLQVYNENPDAVHLASFVGGSLVPFGLATKGMNMMRTGAKGMDWFSKAGQEARLSNINTLFAEGKAATTEYKAALRNHYATGIGNQVLDAGAGELAVLGLMHAHPLMEDYMEDPVKNFALSLGLGAVLGGTIGHIADRYAVKNLVGATNAKAFGEAVEGYMHVSPSWTESAKIQMHEANIQNFENIIQKGKAAGKTADDDLAMSYATKGQNQARLDQVEAFEGMVSPEIRALPKEEKDAFMRDIINNPGIYGVDKVSLFTEAAVTKSPLKGGLTGLVQDTVPANIPTELAPVVKNNLLDEWIASSVQTGAGWNALDVAVHGGGSQELVAGLNWAVKNGRDDLRDAIAVQLQTTKFGISPFAKEQEVIAKKALKEAFPDIAVERKVRNLPEALSDSPTLLKEQKLKNAEGEEIIKKRDISAVWYAEFQKFGKERDVINYGNAAALGKSVEQLDKELPKNYGRVPNLDSSLELAGESSVTVHAKYVAARSRVESWDAEALAKAVVGENDLPLMSAIVQKLRGDFSLARDVKIKLADNAPKLSAIMDEASKGLTKAGLPVDYAQAVAKFTSPQAIHNYNPANEVDDVAKRLINDWLGGDQAALQKGAVAHNAKGYSAAGWREGTTEVRNAFDDIYNSKGSIALREEFAKLQDADGNVLLYRGSKAPKITVQNPLESYSTDPLKAAEFGTVRLYKVHVDNIVAGWADIAGKDGIARNEIVVLPGARIPEATLSTTGVAQFNKKQMTGEIAPTSSKTAMLGDLEEMLINEKQRVMDDMLFNGRPLEEISLKTDTPIDLVTAYATGKNGGAVSLADMTNDLQSLIKTKTLEDAKQAVSPKMAPLKLQGNQIKNPYIEGFTALDNTALKNMNDLVTMTSMFASKNVAVQELAQFMYQDMKEALDIFKHKIGMVNNELAGSKFWNSTDFWARNMQDLGPIATNIGRRIQKIGNDAMGRVVEPLTAAMALVRKDPAATVEFNTFFNVNSQLKGWRQFREDGTLVQKVEKTGADGKIVTVLEPVQVNGQVYKVVTPEVQKLIVDMQNQGGELLSLSNVARRIKGQPDLSDIGLWIPSFNPVGKYIAYVHDTVADTTRLIYANTPEHFADQVTAYKKYLKESGQKHIQVVENKSDQEMWNTLNGRLDAIHMERADVGMQKTGSSSAAIVRTDTNIFNELAGGYEHYITSQVRNIAELNMHEVAGMLDKMSVINNAAFKNQPLTALQKVVKAPEDAAKTMKNTLLGSPNLGEYGGWKSINQSFETGLSFGVNVVGSAWKTATEPLKKAGFWSKEKPLNLDAMKKMDYEKMALELEEKGIMNPWANFDQEAANMFGLAKLEDSKDISKRIVYASNALVATMALRVGELAQPLVNILSLPVLTSLAAANKMPAEFLGAKLGTAKIPPAQAIYEGVRASNSPLWKHFDEMWEKQGHYSPLVSEASNVARMSRSFDKGLIPTIENALDSSMVKIMSKPADWSESFVRRQTMFTGAVIAKRLYPELSDEGITIFARDFMDKAVGNFHASQRPVFFQGTLGTALGLFQTYILTLGQNVYRHLELKNYKALGKAALAQGTIFGAKSLPGFQQVSEMIGEHYSDENVDLTTGTYRALGDTAANFVLYGLPSNLGPSLYTRGDVAIRPPNVLGGAQNTVAVSFASQAMDMLGTFKKAMEQDNASMGRAFGEALSMQSISRPIARGAELATGYSVTRQGNTVQTPEEVWTNTGIISRILGTRPLEESKLREAMHLNTFYGSVDRDARESLLKKLKTQIRSKELTEEDLAKFSGQYFRNGGTPSGWRSAYNKALAQTDVAGDEALVAKMKPNNPLNYMINNLDGHY